MFQGHFSFHIVQNLLIFDGPQTSASVKYLVVPHPLSWLVNSEHKQRPFLSDSPQPEVEFLHCWSVVLPKSLVRSSLSEFSYSGKQFW